MLNKDALNDQLNLIKFMNLGGKLGAQNEFSGIIS